MENQDQSRVQLTYSPTKADIIKTTRLVFWGSTKNKIIIGFFIAAEAILILSLLFSDSDLLALNRFCLLTPALFTGLFFLVLRPNAIAKKTLKNEFLQQQITWNFFDNQYQITTPVSENKIDYSTIRKVKETTEYYLLFLNTASQQYYFIPKQAFQSKTDQENFMALMRKNIQQVQGK